MKKSIVTQIEEKKPIGEGRMVFHNFSENPYKIYFNNCSFSFETKVERQWCAMVLKSKGLNVVNGLSFKNNCI